MDNEDRERLVGLIYENVGVIESIVEEFSADIRAGWRARGAWVAIEERGEVETLIGRVNARDYDEALEAAGLSRVELAYKGDGIVHAREQYQGALRDSRETPGGRAVARWWAVRFLKRFDELLKSLIAATGAGEAFHEFKATLEMDLEEVRTDAR